MKSHQLVLHGTSTGMHTHSHINRVVSVEVNQSVCECQLLTIDTNRGQER